MITHVSVFGVFVLHTWEELSWPLWAVTIEGTKEWIGDEAGVLMWLLSWFLVFQKILTCFQNTLVEKEIGLTFSSDLTKKETENMWELGLRRNRENGRKHWEGIIITGVRLIYL